MLERALLLKDAILKYYKTYPNTSYKGDILNKDEWHVLANIKKFLDKMKQATKVLKSSNQCLNLVLPVMDYVLKQFESARAKYSSDPILTPMLQSGWSKFVDYYHLTNESPAYTIALVLNPRRKWQYINKH
jgi:hypothetical protein